MTMQSVNLPLDDWGQWRRTDKSTAALDYHCPLGEFKPSYVSNDEMCHIEKAYTHLKSVNKKAANAIYYRFVKQSPTEKACKKLKTNKTDYFTHIKMGRMFILGRVFA